MTHLQFNITRISPIEYHVNGVSIIKGDIYLTVGEGINRYEGSVWHVQPIGSKSTERPMFWDSSLEKVLNMVEGAMRMMAPAEDSCNGG